MLTKLIITHICHKLRNQNNNPLSVVTAAVTPSCVCSPAWVTKKRLWDFSGITTISHNALARVSVSQRAKHKGRVTSSCSRGLGCALEPKGSDARLSPRLHRILLISPTAVDWNDFDPRSHPQKPASQGLIRHPTLTPQQLVCVPSEASVDKICYGN